MELPRAEMDGLLADIRGIGKFAGDNLQTYDRTAEYEMLGRRVAALKQNEDELQRFLHSPRHMRGSDILYVQCRLYHARLETAHAAQEQENLHQADGGAW